MGLRPRVKFVVRACSNAVPFWSLRRHRNLGIEAVVGAASAGRDVGFVFESGDSPRILENAAAWQCAVGLQ